uniref:Uncharacterized protein n=1 Tax=Trichuris muris TaxID=70415 RepID=A0A5S6R0E0_TRIMR
MYPIQTSTLTSQAKARDKTFSFLHLSIDHEELTWMNKEILPTYRLQRFFPVKLRGCKPFVGRLRSCCPQHIPACPRPTGDQTVASQSGNQYQ